MQVTIKGAGIIGLSIGWRLLRDGFEVEIFDIGKAGRGASWAAAGMLSPYAEAHFEDDALVKMGEASLTLYPQFLKEVGEDAETTITLESVGTLIVGIDKDDRAFLERLYQEKQKRNFPISWISPEEARKIEPLLTPRITTAIWLPTECQIDNRRLILALIKAFRNRGGILHEESLMQSETGLVINARGAAADPRIRPNKGQILTLFAPASLRPAHVIRSPRVYLVPKTNGSVRVGATSEEKGSSEITAGAIRELLNAAVEIFPAVEEMSFQEAASAFRPLGLDRLPLIEEKGNTILASGHGRAGILLAPYTAETIVKLIGEKYGDSIQRAKRDCGSRNQLV